jgi:hypothetical protein
MHFENGKIAVRLRQSEIEQYGRLRRALIDVEGDEDIAVRLTRIITYDMVSGDDEEVLSTPAHNETKALFAG